MTTIITKRGKKYTLTDTSALNPKTAWAKLKNTGNGLAVKFYNVDGGRALKLELDYSQAVELFQLIGSVVHFEGEHLVTDQELECTFVEKENVTK